MYSKKQIAEELKCREASVETLFKYNVLVDEATGFTGTHNRHLRASPRQVRTLARVWNGQGLVTPLRAQAMREALVALQKGAKIAPPKAVPLLPPPPPLLMKNGNGNGNGHASDPVLQELPLAAPPPPVQMAALSRVMARLDELTAAVNALSERIGVLQDMWK
jgi:hypothetical protein